jgi:hypothetical protein
MGEGKDVVRLNIAQYHWLLLLTVIPVRGRSSLSCSASKRPRRQRWSGRAEAELT